jgi:hypothetical protein
MTKNSSDHPHEPTEGTQDSNQDSGTASKEFTMEELEHIMPDKHHRESFLRLVGQLEDDRAALVTLKGHLVLEEKITAAIEKFVFHSEHLDAARLTFAHKLAIARSISLDESGNSMWDLVKAINKVRNTLSHSLKSARRTDAMNELRSVYTKEMGGKLENWEKDDEAAMVLSSISHCLGFLDAFEQEVERFKEAVNMLDRVVNPHRHSAQSTKHNSEKQPE